MASLSHQDSQQQPDISLSDGNYFSHSVSITQQSTFNNQQSFCTFLVFFLFLHLLYSDQACSHKISFSHKVCACIIFIQLSVV